MRPHIPHRHKHEEITFFPKELGYGGGLEEDGDSRLKGYILKEKLKGLKGCIKSWSKEKSEDVKTQYILCGRKMNELDVKGNEGVG